MGRYRKYTDNFMAMSEALQLKLSAENPTGMNMSPLTRENYEHDIAKDKYRATVIELRPQHSAETTRRQIYKQEEYDHFPCYGQGEYDANAFFFIFTVNPNLAEMSLNYRMEHPDDLNFKTYFGFPYIDDQGIPCGLSFYRFGHEPDAKYVITLIRNTHAPYEQREVTFICSEEIIQTANYPSMQGTDIAENKIFNDLRLQIKSARVTELFATLFTKGKITEENYDKLEARVRHHNLDDSDLLRPQIAKILENVGQLDPSVAGPIKHYIAEDSLDFFEATNYNKFLSYLVKCAQQQMPSNPNLVAAFQDLYLEYLMIQTYYNEKDGGVISNYLVNGIADVRLHSLKNTFIQNTNNQNINTQKFAKQANQFYKHIHFNKLITELENTIFASKSSEGLKHTADSHLTRLRKISTHFATYPHSQQQTILNFTRALISFVDEPNEMAYTQLYELYPKVKLDPKSLEPLQAEIEHDNFRSQMSKLRENIALCTHPYIQKEIKNNLRFLRRKSQTASTTAEQISINQFVKLLNEISKKDSLDISTIEELEKFYRELGLGPLVPEQKIHLLQPISIAQMQQQIDEKNYIFDTQGHILVSPLSTGQNNQLLTYSLDVTTSHPSIATEFTELLTSALQKQTTARDAGRILNLFNAKKRVILPLQEFLQIYLTQMAQTYQIAMQESNLSDQAMQAAIMKSLHEINPEMITILARGLVRASNIGHFKEMLKLDTDKLNRILIEAQDDLCQHCKPILIKHLQQQFHSQSAATHTPSLPISKHEHKEKDIQSVYFDETQPFAYVIKSKHPDPDYLCSEIKTYRSQDNSFSDEDLIDHVRVQTTAFNFSQDMSDRAYQPQFQQRLTQIAGVYNFRHLEQPLIYNMYGASEEQINQNLLAVHHYNRSVRAEKNSKLPLCLLQAWNLSNPPLNMGYSLFDLNGSISETTLMCEMALCDQVLNKDGQSLTLDAYDNFLNSSSILGNILSKNLFAFSADGRQMRQQIAEHKTSWKETQYPDDVGNPKKVTVRALQKLMAFNLHYDPAQVLLVQALSLNIQDKSLLGEDEEPLEQTMRLGLGYAQIFDLPTLPSDLVEPFNMLLCATDKKTAATAAKIIKDHMETYYLKHSNGATMLSITQKAIESAQNSTSVRDIASTVSALLEKPRAIKPSVITQQTQRASNPQKHSTSVSTAPNITARERSISSTVKSRHRLFHEKTSEDDILQPAAKNKAAAFGRGRSGSGDSE